MNRDNLKNILNDSVFAPTGQKLNNWWEIFEHYGDLSNMYVSYTSLEKLGLNPQSKYDTPLGVYCYQAQYVKDTLQEGDRVPFVGDAPWINIFKVKDGFNTWTITEKDGAPGLSEYLSYTESVETPETVEGLLDILNTIDLEIPLSTNCVNLALKYIKNKKAILRVFYDALDSCRERNWPDTSFFWAFTYHLSRKVKMSSGIKTITFWNKLIRELGISAISDWGTKTIHPNEPTQAVILDPRSIERINQIQNPDTKSAYMKSDNPQVIEKLIQDKNYKALKQLISAGKELWSHLYIYKIAETGDFKLIKLFLDSYEDHYKLWWPVWIKVLALFGSEEGLNYIQGKFDTLTPEDALKAVYNVIQGDNPSVPLLKAVSPLFSEIKDKEQFQKMAFNEGIIKNLSPDVLEYLIDNGLFPSMNIKDQILSIHDDNPLKSLYVKVIQSGNWRLFNYILNNYTPSYLDMKNFYWRNLLNSYYAKNKAVMLSVLNNAMWIQLLGRKDRNSETVKDIRELDKQGTLNYDGVRYLLPREILHGIEKFNDTEIANFISLCWNYIIRLNLEDEYNSLISESPPKNDRQKLVKMAQTLYNKDHKLGSKNE